MGEGVQHPGPEQLDHVGRHHAVRSVLVGSNGDVTLALAWSSLLVVIFTPIAILRYRHA
jgi:hypothetical protein